MVLFNELRIADDKQSIFVDCYIEGLGIYSDMYIKEIYIDYYKNALTSGVPSDKAIKIYDNTNDQTSVNAVRTCLLASDSQVEQNFGISDFDSGMFYVYVYCDGTLPASVSTLPCGYDDTSDTGVIVDWKKMYQIGMQYVSTLSSRCFDKCNDVFGFDNFIFVWNALKLAISTCDYSLAEKIWEKFIRYYNPSAITGNSGCRCNK